MENNPLNEYEEVRIPVPWGYIAGRWYGERNVRPILTMHGWLDNSGTWDTLIPLMPPHIGLLVIDMPGHGKSSRLPAGILYHVLYYVRDIMRVMREYNWDKVSIMAHSMSAINSFIFAALYPDKVDMLIQIDVIHPRVRSVDFQLKTTAMYIENFMLEEKRIRKQHLEEPPSYSYDELVERMFIGTDGSVDKDKCKHILESNITKSKRYPSKYYFSRDPRIKYYMEYYPTIEVVLSMAKRIKVPQLVIKGSRSNFISLDDPAIQVLRDNNPFFEFHVVEGTHHVHLNNAEETGLLVRAFINKWRPPPAPEVMEQQPQAWVERRQKWRLEKAKL